MTGTETNSDSMPLTQIVGVILAVNAPTFTGVAAVWLAELQSAATILMTIVSVICTILVTRHTLRKK